MEEELTEERERFLWKHQWCQLHLSNCRDVNVLLRGAGLGSVPLIVCPKCLGILKKLGAVEPALWGRHECWSIQVPKSRAGGVRKPYVVELEEWQVILLRALGYRVTDERSNDDDEAEGNAGGDALQGVSDL